MSNKSVKIRPSYQLPKGIKPPKFKVTQDVNLKNSQYLWVITGCRLGYGNSWFYDLVANTQDTITATGIPEDRIIA